MAGRGGRAGGKLWRTAPGGRDERAWIFGKARALARALGLTLAGSLGLVLLLFLAVHVEDALLFSLNATSAAVHAAGRRAHERLQIGAAALFPTFRAPRGPSVEERLLRAAEEGDIIVLNRAVHAMRVHNAHRHAVLDMALYYAAAEDQLECVSFLLRREGVDPNEGHHGASDHTTLTVAAAKGHADVVRLLLLTRGGTLDFNVRAKRGKTALMWAAVNGHTEIVRMLAGFHDAEAGKHRNNVDLDARDTKYHRTALMWAVVNHHSDIVDVLLRAGADPHLKYTYNPFVKREHRHQHHTSAMFFAQHYEHHAAVKHLETHIEAQRHVVPAGPEHAAELDALREELYGRRGGGAVGGSSGGGEL
jgi:ankyrin repeat protein